MEVPKNEETKNEEIGGEQQISTEEIQNDEKMNRQILESLEGLPFENLKPIEFSFSDKFFDELNKSNVLLTENQIEIISAPLPNSKELKGSEETNRGPFLMGTKNEFQKQEEIPKKKKRKRMEGKSNKDLLNGGSTEILDLTVVGEIGTSIPPKFSQQPPSKLDEIGRLLEELESSKSKKPKLGNETENSGMNPLPDFSQQPPGSILVNTKLPLPLETFKILPEKSKPQPLQFLSNSLLSNPHQTPLPSSTTYHSPLLSNTPLLHHKPNHSLNSNNNIFAPKLWGKEGVNGVIDLSEDDNTILPLGQFIVIDSDDEGLEDSPSKIPNTVNLSESDQVQLDIQAVQKTIQRDFDNMPEAEKSSELIPDLMFYQKQGLKWLLDQENKDTPHVGGILADDMGLGKTVQAIALILSNRPPPEEKFKTTLIICPLSTLFQ